MPEASSRQDERGRSHFTWLLGSWIGVVLFVVLGRIVEPDSRGFGTHERLGLPACRLKATTGLPCPGCGVTTSLTLASQGRVAESLRNQPMGLLLAIALPLFALWALVQHLRGADVGATMGAFFTGRVVLLGGAVFVAAWIYKLASTLGAGSTT